MLHGYATNRYDFLNAARKAGAKTIVYNFPPELSVVKNLLALDVAVFGNTNAPVTFVITSGIHGVELPLGSALQCAWMASAQEVCRSGRIRMVFAHALNPFGAHHGRRNDHQNIDPNRNFLDFSKPLPSSDNYRPLADDFTPRDLDNGTLFRAYAQMLTFAFVTHSLPAFKQALVGGQSDYPHGLFYCGKEPSWTRQRWDEIVRDHVRPQNAEHLWHVDIHSGEGPYGVMHLFMSEKQAFQRVKNIDGLNVAPVMVQNNYATLAGGLCDAWKVLYGCDNARLTAMAVEVGTSRMKGPLRGLDVLHHGLIKRNVLREHYGDNHPQASDIIVKTRETFCPSDPHWQGAALRQGQELWPRLLNAALSL